MNKSKINNKNISISKVAVKKSGISGKGLFAVVNISKNEIIYTVKGNILEFHPDDDTWSVPHAISYAKNKWINPNPDNPLRYTNHSCSPNAIIGEELKVIALRDIKIGEEVTIDYSLAEDDPETRVGKCRCGLKNCRGEILSIHSLSESIVKQNQKYLRKWIVDSYYENRVLKHNKK